MTELELVQTKLDCQYKMNTDLIKQIMELKAENKELYDSELFSRWYSEINVPEDCKDMQFGRILDRITKVLNEGKGHNGDWKTKDVWYHIDRAEKQLSAHRLKITTDLLDEDEEDHLGHALVRVCFAILKGE